MSTPEWLDRAGWPYTPRFVALPEGRLHYVDEGTGDTVVLVHGTPTWSYEWRHVIAGAEGHAPAGRPRSSGLRAVGSTRATPATRRRTTRGGSAPRSAHLAPADPITLVVHDFGGPIALDWALDHPARLARVVVVNSWMWSFDDDPSMRRKAAMIRGARGPLALSPAERVAAADHAIGLR